MMLIRFYLLNFGFEIKKTFKAKLNGFKKQLNKTIVLLRELITEWFLIFMYTEFSKKKEITPFT